MVPEWHAIGVFCEDIRPEKEGVMSVMGILPDNVEVPTFPGLFFRLGVYVRINILPTSGINQAEVAIRFPNEQQQTLGTFDAKAIEKSKSDARASGVHWCGLITTAIAGNVAIQEPGIFHLIAKVGNEETICGSLTIHQSKATPSSTASEQPA